jgi:hypothetical protein
MLARGPETGNLRPSVHLFSMRGSSPPLRNQFRNKSLLPCNSTTAFGNMTLHVAKPFRTAAQLILCFEQQPMSVRPAWRGRARTGPYPQISAR